MKTVHIHHDGQYWRGFKHGLVGLCAVASVLVLAAASLQPAHSQAEPASLNQIDPASVGPIRPLPEWFKAYDTVTLDARTIYDLDRHGMRPVSAARADRCS